ncbi:hypothetical protein [Nocardia wallacei]|uniref:Uncharacterized protein n=1 Tax=Nocardia wallacei TaxID=480035 RepID=A0A7G1KV04_9NOCA|nr:hypothetical protein [Nocardia wallacei]BCK58386.1 hypothetical protein NWFMUON74_61580 [Nocardia wallacei]
MAIKYYNLREFAEFIGLPKSTLQKYKLPPHDAIIGRSKGWLPQTCKEWNERRPGVRVPKEKSRWNLPPELQ